MANSSQLFKDDEREKAKGTSDDELRHLTGIGKDEEGAMDRQAHSGADDDIAQREGLFNKDGDSPSKDSTAAAPDDLRSAESAPAGDDDKASLYNKEASQKKEQRFKSRLGSNSAFKKKLAIAGVAAGGSVVLGIIAFLALLPLKIEGIIDNLDSRFTAASEGALDNETENLYSRYITEQVLPNFNKSSCHSTIDASCVSLSKDTGPVGKLYNTWTQSRLENKMATKYNIMIGKKGTQYYMNVGNFTGDDKDVKAVASGTSIFDLPGTTPKDRNQVRKAVRDSLKDATLYDRVYFRFKVGKLLEEKYGIKRCVIACDAQDKFTDSVSDKKVAAKAYIVRRVVSPFSQSSGLILQCILNGTCDSDTSSLSASTEPGDAEQISPFQQNLNQQLDDYAEQFGQDKLASLVKTANGISKDGLSKYLFSQATSKAISVDLTDETSEAAAEDASPVAILNLVSQIVKFVSSIGPAVKKINYAVSSAAAVQMYMTFRTVTDEVHSGHVDPTELGSFTDQLDNGGVDASSTPLYANLMGNNSSNVSFNTPLPSASADAPTTDGTYKCASGKPVAAGQLVCPEEVFDGGNAFATNLSSEAQKIPGWSVLLTASNIFQKVNNLFGSALSAILDHIPGFGSVSNLINQALSPLFKLVTDDLITSPLKDATDGIVPGGGRTFDMIAAGDDVAQNKSCETQLGCAKITPAQAAVIQNQQLQDQKAAFDQQSMFARMFSTSSPYSLVSRLAMDLPTNLVSGANNTLASLLSDPFGKLASAFSSIFSTNRAFASSTVEPDPFGVTQYGWTADQLNQLDAAVNQAGGYGKYWSQNCMGDYTTAFVNAQTQDPDTGDAVATAASPCMLVNSAIQSAGGLTDSSLLPAGSTNSDTDTSTTTTSTAGSTIDLTDLYDSSVNVACAVGTNDIGVQQGYTNGKEVDIRVCAIPGFKQDNDQLNNFGVTGSGGDIVVNSRVSGAVLAMFSAAKQSGLVFTGISSFRTMAYQKSLCPCDGVHVGMPGYSNHQMGLAIDFGGLTDTPGPLPGNPVWDWLTKNAATYGYKNYPLESWHWSPTGN